MTEIKMRLSKHVMAQTLKTQHDELKDTQDELREIALCFGGIGMSQVADKIDAQLERIGNTMPKLKAVIESLEGDA